MSKKNKSPDTSYAPAPEAPAPEAKAPAPDPGIEAAAKARAARSQAAAKARIAAREQADAEAEAAAEEGELDYFYVVAPGKSISCGAYVVDAGESICEEQLSDNPKAAAKAMLAHFNAGTVVEDT